MQGQHIYFTASRELGAIMQSLSVSCSAQLPPMLEHTVYTTTYNWSGS